MSKEGFTYLDEGDDFMEGTVKVIEPKVKKSFEEKFPDQFLQQNQSKDKKERD